MSFQGGIEQFKNPRVPEDVEFEDLTLDTEEGVRAFLANAEDVYAEAKQKEQWAKDRDFEGLSTSDLDGEKIYEELFIRIQNIRDLARISPQELTDDEVAEMQDCYDDMLKLRDHVMALYENIESQASADEEVMETSGTTEVPEEAASIVETVSEDAEQPSQQTAAADADVETNETGFSAEVSTSEPATPESALVAEEKLPEVDQKEAIEAAGVKIRKVLLHGVEVREHFSALGQLTEGGVLSGALATSLERARLTEEQITALAVTGETASEVQAHLESYARLTTEIDTNISAIEDVLKRKTASSGESAEKLPGLTTQKARIATVLERAKGLQRQFETSGIMHPDGVVSIELGETFRAAQTIEAKLNALTGTTDNDRTELETYNTRITGLVQSLDDAERAYEKKKASKPKVDTTIVRETGVVETKAETPETKESFEPAEAEAEPEVEVVPVVESPVEGELLPAEADAALLLKAVRQNQFYTDEERMTAQSMAEAFHRAVAERKSPETIKTQFENLNSFVEDLQQHPSLEYVNERVGRIMERTAQAREGSDFTKTIATLKENYDRIRSESPENEERILSAYRNIEQTAFDFEDEWLSVCGMRLPKAGPEGVFGARSLREGLLVARDRHRELVQDPEKQVLVDKMVRLLSSVPNEGLTKEQVAELTATAREIDVYESLVNARQSKSAIEKKPEPTPSVVVESDVAEEEMVTPRKGKLNVVRVETEEGSIQLKDKTGNERKFRDAVLAGEEAVDNVVPLEEAIDELEVATEEVVEEEESTDVISESEVETVVEEPVTEVAPNDDEAALADVEQEDPINEVVPESMERPTVRSWQERRALAGTLVEIGPLISEYPEFFENYEPTEFDRVMRYEVAAFERKFEDGLERILGIKRNSAFGLIKDKSIAEVQSLLGEYDAGRREAFQERFNVSYTAFIEWCDQIDEMGQLVEIDDTMTLGELYARWIIEQELR